MPIPIPPFAPVIRIEPLEVDISRPKRGWFVSLVSEKNQGETEHLVGEVPRQVLYVGEVRRADTLD